jgi:predicted dehydrogenase
MIRFSEPSRQLGQTHVLKLACDPIPLVRIAFIGLGKRGKEAFSNFMYIEGVKIVAICDVHLDAIAEVQKMLSEHANQLAEVYSQPNDWETICERTDIDLVYICTPRQLHTPIGVYAMEHGKHVAIEVPAANTIDECWQLVDTSERTRRHCMMLENCCYDSFELAILNMAQHGLFGEIFHVEGAYIHDLRTLDFDLKPHYLDVWSMQGNPYPTHGLGPLCQLLNIHRGDKLAWLTSVSSGQFGLPEYGETDREKHTILGNMNTTIIRTEKDKTIVLQHDISSPRPYSRNYLLSGTKGFVQKRTHPEIAFSSANNEILSKEETDVLLTNYEHPYYKEMGELARRVGGHGGMDFVMDYRLIYCLGNGLPLDMDVYDAAEWSCIVALSAASVANGSGPVSIPDFTRGATSI